MGLPSRGEQSPVYSATEAREDAADAVSQSRSVLLLGLRLRMGRASKDSTLQEEQAQGEGCTATGPSPPTCSAAQDPFAGSPSSGRQKVAHTPYGRARTHTQTQAKVNTTYFQPRGKGSPSQPKSEDAAMGARATELLAQEWRQSCVSRVLQPGSRTPVHPSGKGKPQRLRSGSSEPHLQEHPTVPCW